MELINSFINFLVTDWHLNLLTVFIVLVVNLLDTRWRQRREMKHVYGRNHKEVRKVMMPAWGTTFKSALVQFPIMIIVVFVVAYILELNRHYINIFSWL